MRASIDRVPTRCLIALILASAVVWPASASAQVTYTIQDLGTGATGLFLFGNRVFLGINASGQVAGSYYLNGSSGDAHAFRTTATGTFNDPGADLGTYGGPFSYGLGINTAGQVTGYAQINSGNVERPYRTTATGLISDPGTDLGTNGGGAYGMGINASGQVTGFSDRQIGGFPFLHAARTTATGRFSDPGTDLGTLPGRDMSLGLGINDAGQVTGYSFNSGSNTRAFRTTALGTLTDPGADLGTFGGDSVGNAINAVGQVTGRSTTASGVQHAFRTTATGLISDPGADLGLGEGYGINSFGVVVGVSNGHAFVYDTQMRDLNGLLINGSGWLLTNAFGINDAGRIAGFGTFGGQTHAFRLTPVPEPSALVLFGAAAVAFVARRRRFRAARHGPTFS